ncbi:hypothetical protein Patl1_17996 [Pistacia atlantica]|uniref:Uncharacterized protein n=1 Tax=Pistacia atlantica TaxID=434234 RepID=A0ACC1C187_9ROSI|nr:hypothetical protein Patl1_17996 [Pistacia atlantica]
MGSGRRVRKVKERRREGDQVCEGWVEVHEMKVEKLQSLVPGGEELQHLDQLLVHATDYIFYLRKQVCVLEAILKLNQPLTFS